MLATARERVGVDPEAHEPPEQLAPHAEAPAARRSPCPAAFPSKVVASTAPSPVTTRSAPRGARVEADQVEHELAAGDELRPERGERRAEPAARAGTGQLRGRAPAPPSRRAAARARRPRPGPLPSAARTPARRLAGRAAGSSRHTRRESGTPSRPPPDALHASRPRRRPSPSHRRRRAATAAPCAAAASSRSPTPWLVALSGSRSARVNERQADRLRRLDHRRAVGQHQPATPRRARPSGPWTTALRHSPPSAAASTAAVPSPPSATGASIDLDPVDAAHPLREGRRGLERREDAFEASRGCQREHVRAPRQRHRARVAADRPPRLV